jgi:hypothetical protein
VLFLVSVATVTLFLLADTAGSVTGLTTLPGRSPRNAQLIESYAAAGRFYPSYIAACILPGTFLAIGTNLPMALRLGALLLTVAFAGLVLGSFFPLIPKPLGFLESFINYISVLCLAVGLVLVWIASLVARRRTRNKSELSGMLASHHSQNH